MSNSHISTLPHKVRHYCFHILFQTRILLILVKCDSIVFVSNIYIFVMISKYGLSLRINVRHTFSIHRAVMHFSQNNRNSPSSITLLFSIMRHVSASTYGHDQTFVHYIKVNIHMDTCHLYTLQKPDDGHR